VEAEFPHHFVRPTNYSEEFKDESRDERPIKREGSRHKDTHITFKENLITHIEYTIHLLFE
jgi:hypothetical protein